MGSAQKRVLFQVIDEMRPRYSLAILLHFSGLSKSGYYKWRNTRSHARLTIDLEQHIMAIHSVRPYYGYRRMTVALNREGFAVNHKRVYRIMRERGIQSIIRKKRRYFGKTGGNVFPNLLKRNFTSKHPGLKLVTDITYLPTTSGFIYLSAVMDLYNNEIVAHSFSNRNNLELVFGSLAKLASSPGAIVHSDQGYQYTHKIYQQKLTQLKLQGSHSRKGNCLDNASMESFFSHLKTEAFAGKALCSADDTQAMIEEHIRFHNSERFQKRLGQLSPLEYRKKLAA